ncbi:class 1 fructose-bisphosphatase [Nitratifractor sp.]
MLSIFETLKSIAFAVDEAIKTEDLGYASGRNATGDDQLKLDVRADGIVESILSQHPLVYSIISEEKEEELIVHPDGRYTVCYDPLDGSSIVEADLSVGTIFGIYEKGKLTGSGLRGSAYIVYGPRLELVAAVRGRAPRHYRSGSEGLFAVRRSLRLGEKGKLNAPGGTQKYWLPEHKAFVDSLFAEGYRLRYSGGMVPDLHQILVKAGGIFSYPGTSDKPEGKLRALFEVLPFALIYEAAGGEAVDQRGRRLLELVPSSLHATTPCFFGSSYEIGRFKEAYGVNDG